MDGIQHELERIKSGKLSLEELIAFSLNENQSIKGTAFMALAKNYPLDSRTVEHLRRAALDEGNRASRIFGGNSIAHVCVKLLSDIDSPAAQRAFKELLDAWPVSDRELLEWLLAHSL